MTLKHRVMIQRQLKSCKQLPNFIYNNKYKIIKKSLIITTLAATVVAAAVVVIGVVVTSVTLSIILLFNQEVKVEFFDIHNCFGTLNAAVIPQWKAIESKRPAASNKVPVLCTKKMTRI
jgi:hypothetical protein